MIVRATERLCVHCILDSTYTPIKPLRYAAGPLKDPRTGTPMCVCLATALPARSGCAVPGAAARSTCSCAVHCPSSAASRSRCAVSVRTCKARHRSPGYVSTRAYPAASVPLQRRARLGPRRVRSPARCASNRLVRIQQAACVSMGHRLSAGRTDASNSAHVAMPQGAPAGRTACMRE